MVAGREPEPPAQVRAGGTGRGLALCGAPVLGGRRPPVLRGIAGVRAVSSAPFWRALVRVRRVGCEGKVLP